MRNFYDNFFFGLFAGLLGLVIGFYVVGFFWSLINETDMEFWIDKVFLDATFYRVKVLTSSALLNVVAFFFLYQKGVYETAKGILGTLILLVLVMALFWAN
jgi:hypothetical protein